MDTNRPPIVNSELISDIEYVASEFQDIADMVISSRNQNKQNHDEAENALYDLVSPVQHNLMHIINDDSLSNVQVWLEWNKSEVAKDINTRLATIVDFSDKLIDVSDCPHTFACVEMIRGCCSGIAQQLRRIAEMARKVIKASEPVYVSDLNQTERNIIEALSEKTLTGEQLAKEAGYPSNSNFKTTLSNLRKRGILGNKSPGYFLKPDYHFLLKQTHRSQDKGQD